MGRSYQSWISTEKDIALTESGRCCQDRLWPVPDAWFCYKLLGREADEADAEEIIDTASKASLGDQKKQVQENIHSQIKGFSAFKDDILLLRKRLWTHESSNQINSIRRIMVLYVEAVFAPICAQELKLNFRRKRWAQDRRTSLSRHSMILMLTCSRPDDFQIYV